MRKQLFYLTNHEMTAFVWQGKHLSQAASFSNDEAGWATFGVYLEHAEPAPAFLLIDLIEEDFQRDTLPHVSGKARTALLERRLSSLYRDTPFRHATAQGREKEGRKDDRYLFNALTNADLPKPWLAAMLKQALPLVGIYSLASLSQLLFDKLKLDAGPVLLVSHQSSGLRQSYFHEGYLRFSRLTPLFDHATDRLVEVFRTETAKTRQFLASTRLLGRGDKVQVIVLANAENLAALQETLEETNEVGYRLIVIEQAQRLLGVGQFDCSADCNPLYLALLASAKVATHFPLRDQKHFYPLLQARMALYGLSGAVALAAVIWATIDVLTVFELRRQAAQHELEAAAAESRFQGVIKDMPQTPVTPHNMKTVVDIERMITEHVPVPSTQIGIIGRVLNDLPQLKIRKFHWQVIDPATLLAPVDPNAPVIPAPLDEVAPAPALLGLPERSAQTVMLEGEVDPYNDDYRFAIDSVNLFAAQLNRQPLLKAEVTQLPLDMRTSATLQNSAGLTENQPKAPFTMTLTWRP